MALHARQQIREAAKAHLLSKTSAGARVFENRKFSWKMVELPAISIYSGDETSDDEETAPREYKRTLDLTIEAVVVADENLDDALDALALQIEKAMDADPTLGGAAGDTSLTRTTIGAWEEGNRPIGAVQLTYRAIYHTDAPEAADVALDDLKTIGVETSLGGAQAEADRTKDLVDLSE